MTHKELDFGQTGRDRMLKGVEKLSKAVAATLGPRGRTVVIQRPGQGPQITKDGITVAQSIKLKDPVENMGAEMIREVASRTVDITGDGTTTATVLAAGIVREGLKMIAAGADPMNIKRGIDKAVEKIVEEIRQLSQAVDGIVGISQVATISSNGDVEIGTMIAEAMGKVGNDGHISLEDSKNGSGNCELRVSAGFEFDRGFKSPYFITDHERQEAACDNPAVWLINGKLSSRLQLDQMMPVLEKFGKSQQPLVIIAEDFDGEVLATLAVNAAKRSLPVLAIKTPGFGDSRRDVMEDLAASTGATLFSLEFDGLWKGEDDKEKTTEEIIEELIDGLGTARRVVSTKEKTVVVIADGFEDRIEAQANKIRAALENATASYTKEVLTKRLAKLTGGVAVIEVGAATEIEMQEKKDRIEDALAATQAAVREGIVPGGGVALVRAVKTLEDFSTGNVEEDIGVKIVFAACLTPLRQIAQNAGDAGDVVVAKVKEELTGNFGYNAATRRYEDLVAAGIVDPAQVARVALQNAASVAALILTTEAIVSIDETDQTSQQPHHNMMM